MLIIPELNTIFIHVLKTGGKSVTRSLIQYCKDEHIFTKDVDYFSYNPIRDEMVKHAHYTANEIKKVTGSFFYDRAFKFLFVRNPWDRYVSFYFYGLKKLNPQPFPDFNSFIKYVVGIINKDNIGSWENAKLKQTDFLNDDVDYIGRFENLNICFDVVCQKIGISLKLPHVNASNHKNYRHYYTDENKKLIENYCSKEIERFNYTF